MRFQNYNIVKWHDRIAILKILSTLIVLDMSGGYLGRLEDGATGRLYVDDKV